MPLYDLRNSETDEVQEVFMSYDSLQEYLEKNPQWKIIHKKTMTIVTETGDFFSRVPDSFNDHLKTIKKGSGFSNTIKTK